MARILLMTQSKYSIDPVYRLLIHEGHDVGAVKNPEEAHVLMSERRFDVALIRCQSVSAARGYLGELKDRDPYMTIIVMPMSSAPRRPYEALEAGADGFVFRPFRTDKIRQAVAEGLKMCEFKARSEDMVACHAFRSDDIVWGTRWAYPKDGG